MTYEEKVKIVELLKENDKEIDAAFARREEITAHLNTQEKNAVVDMLMSDKQQHWNLR